MIEPSSCRLPPWEQIARASQLSALAGLRDLRELRRAFRSDRTRYRLLERLRWPNGFVCSRCEDRAEPRRPRGGLLTCARCGAFHDITAGGLIAPKVAPLSHWFDLFWVVARKLSPQAQSVTTALEPTAGEATRVVRGLQRVFAHVERQRLAGALELDARVMALPGVHAIVLLAVERSDDACGRMHARVVSSIRAEVVQQFIEDVVETGSTLHTDCWSAYLSLEDLPYHHAPQQTASSEGELKAVDHCAAMLQRWLRKRSPEDGVDLDGVVAEFTMRFNRVRRSTTGALFCDLLSSALSMGAERNIRRISGVRRIELPAALVRDRQRKIAG